MREAPTSAGPPPRGVARLAAAAGLTVIVLMVVAAGAAWSGDSPLVPRAGGVPGGSGAWPFLALLATAFAAYLAGLAALRADMSGRCARLAVVVAVVVQLAPVGVPLLLSTDAWTYWSYGWIGQAGGNPYAEVPQAYPESPALPWMGADWRGTTTVYGPAFTLASEPVAIMAGSSADAAAWIFKGLAGLCGVGCSLLAGRLARRREALAVAFVGWNPVLAVHLAGGGHNDAWVAALVVAALALAQARRLDAAGVAWALAVLVKWVPIVFLVLRGLEGRATGRPTRHAGFAAAALAVLGLATWRYGLDWTRAVLPLAANAERTTSYALPARLESAGVPEAAALALAGVGLAGGLTVLARSALRGRARLGLTGCLLLVTTPYLAAWYLAWPVTLSAADDDDGLARLASLALCAYLLPFAIPL